MEFLIGDKVLLEKNATLVYVEDRPWILYIDSNNNPILYDAICPHMNGVVSELKNDRWHCPNHLWEFDPQTGNAIKTPSKYLKSYPVTIRNDKIYAELPIKPKLELKNKSLKIPPKITVISAAGLLFQWKGFNILSDPWMIGPCMLGSWNNYPPEMNVKDLPKLDAIWISHEHSDHYNEPTLSLLDKNIPVYLTKFDDRHLANRIEKLGFKNIIEIKTGEPIFLTDEIQLISFKSASVWNDSISFWKFGNFSILNVNDAGFNWTVKDVVGKVDLLCQQFSGPTSSYPYVWDHLDENQKLRIIIGMNNGYLNMMKTVAEILDVQYILPFASFFEITNPEHEKYDQLMKKNSLKQVVKFFKNTKFKVLDLFPKESWDGNFFRIPEHEKYFDKDFKKKFLKKKHIEEAKKGFKPKKFDIDHHEIKDYFEAFSDSNLTKEVGYYKIFLKVEGEKRNLEALIIFDNGKVQYEPNPNNKRADMTMVCPGPILQEIIQKDLSWDEAYNGFWITFSRNPDIYNIHLWKLLYAPWRARPEYIQQTDLEYNVDPLRMSIADIIEKGGENASKIFENYGLYCTGCELGMGETIEDGCQFHGIDKQKTKKLIDELATLNYDN